MPSSRNRGASSSSPTRSSAAVVAAVAVAIVGGVTLLSMRSGPAPEEGGTPRPRGVGADGGRTGAAASSRGESDFLRRESEPRSGEASADLGRGGAEPGGQAGTRPGRARPLPGEARRGVGEVIGPAGGIAPQGGTVEMPRLPELDWDLPDEPPRQVETSWYPAQELERDGRRIEEHGDHVAMRTEGTLRGTFELANPVTEISIWAWGREARGEAPRARVWLNGEFVGEFEAQSPELREYTFPVWGEPTEVELRMKFVNDYFEGPGGEDRDLFVHGVTITTLAPES